MPLSSHPCLPLLTKTSCAARPLRSAGITPRLHYYEPSRHRLVVINLYEPEPVTIQVIQHDGRLVLRVHPAGGTPQPADLLAEDVAGAMRKRALLEKALGLSLTVRAG